MPVKKCVGKKRTTYFIDFYAGGKRYRERVGSSKKAAEIKLGKRLKEIEDGTFNDQKIKRLAGKMDVVLVRDLTDCMYNPKRWPYVDHFTGNDLVTWHIEKYWCPTVTSDQVLGGAPFRFAADTKPPRKYAGLLLEHPMPESLITRSGGTPIS